MSAAAGGWITSVSCASPGNCSAGGFYDGQPGQEAFVVSEVNGRWRRAEEVPGTAALDNGHAAINSVSCASAGNCSAGGYYDSQSGQEAFVVSKVHGRWRRAEEVPGTAALNKDGNAKITSVSCASPGNCSAGGYYTASVDGGGFDIFQAFAVSEVKGRWRKAEKVPGTAALNKHGSAEITSVSCGSAGNCGAGGYYNDSRYGTNSKAFVVSEVGGIWRKAEEVPGTAALNKGPNGGSITSVSCASAGHCSAGGSYQAAGSSGGNTGTDQAFVVSEVDGRWRKAEIVPGTASLSRGRGAELDSVSCASAGNCSAGGSYAERSLGKAFVVSEVKGTWRKAEEVPGISALNKGGYAQFASVSCASPGNCSAGGFYAAGLDAGGGYIYQAFVVSELNGTWRRAEEVPGIAALSNGGYAEITSVSCASPRRCGAGGFFEIASGGGAFVVSRK